MPRRSLLVLAALSSSAAFAACVGDEATAVIVTNDGGSGDASAPVDAAPTDTGAADVAVTDSGEDTGVDSASDAGVDSGVDSGVDAGDGGDAGDSGGPPPTCAGRTFANPVQVDFTASPQVGPFVWGPRIVSGSAFFASVPAGQGDQQIMRATVGVNPPSFSGAVVIPGVSDVGAEWAPTVSSNGGLMVFGRGLTPTRELFYATQTGADYTGATAIGNLNTAGDEADPWLAGAPAVAALYFARAQNGPMQIFRAPATHNAPNPPVFSAATQVVVACPEANCGTPVAPHIESMMLFGSWANGGFVPSVQEVALSKNGNLVQPTGAIVAHPELGNRYPSWVSADGCQVYLATGAPNQVYFAQRTPQ